MVETLEILVCSNKQGVSIQTTFYYQGSNKKVKNVNGKF